MFLQASVHDIRIDFRSYYLLSALFSYKFCSSLVWTEFIVLSLNTHLRRKCSCWRAKILMKYCTWTMSFNDILQEKYNNWEAILIMTADFRKYLRADGSLTETCRCLNICQLKMEAGCMELKLDCSVNIIHYSNTTIVWRNSICDEDKTTYSLDSENIPSKSKCTRDLLCNMY